MIYLGVVLHFPFVVNRTFNSAPRGCNNGHSFLAYLYIIVVLLCDFTFMI